MSGLEPPVPIPNTEVKRTSAEDSCRASGRENRSRPEDLRAKSRKAGQEKVGNDPVTLQKATTMADLLAKSGLKIRSFSIGEKVRAKVLETGNDVVLFDIGGKTEGILKDSFFDESKKFASNLTVGESVTVTVVIPENSDGQTVVSLRDTAANDVWDRLIQAKKDTKKVTVAIKGVSESGVTAEIDGITGFIPMSQMSKKLISNLDSLAGQRVEVLVVEIDQRKNRLVFSERRVSEAAEIKAIDDVLAKITKGNEIYEGKVITLTKFGAFVEIKVQGVKSQVALEGLVHVSEISWEKTKDPKDVLAVGDTVKVKVLESKEGKLSLSIKQAQDDPWKTIADKYKADSKIKGKVTRKTDFGAFVGLEPGVEGLIHLTKIPPGTKMDIGQEINCYVEEVDPRDRRISLGMVLTSKPIGYK